MKLLLDECVTRYLKPDFIGHDVKTVREAGFTGLKNGQLLKAAETEFDILVTVDKSIRHQQSLVLPVASSATKLLLDDATYKGIEKELDLGQKSIESVIKGGEKLGSWLGENDAPDMEHGEGVRAQGAILRQLHSFLKEKDPGFGGLVRVRNKRQEFLWVHPQFEKEY